MNSKNICLTCSKTVVGRSDKKFCNDYCRNVFNNSRKVPEPPVVANINRILARNRSIMNSFLNGNETRKKMDRDKLLIEGFHFNYYTHKCSNNRGKVYYYCYDTGYTNIDADQVIVIRQVSKHV